MDHDAPCLPRKTLHSHCLRFLLERLQYPGEIGNNGDAKFGGVGWGGVNKVHYGLHENGELNLFSSDKLPSQSTAYTPLPCQNNNNNNNNNIKNGKQGQLSMRNVCG